MGYYSYSANVIIHKNYSPDATREISRSGQQYVAQGSTFYVYVPLSNSESFTRSGYDFVGYGYNTSPSSLSYYPGDSITFMFNGGGTQNIHLYCGSCVISRKASNLRHISAASSAAGISLKMRRRGSVPEKRAMTQAAAPKDTLHPSI
jgi:hypothetical protein